MIRRGVDSLLGWHVYRATTLRFYLYLAGLHQEVEVSEGFGHIVAHGQNAVVSQDHHGFVTQIPDQALPLIKVERYAFIFVVTQVLKAQHGGLAQGLEAITVG